MSIPSPSYPEHAGPPSIPYARMQDGHADALTEPFESGPSSTAQTEFSFRESHRFFWHENTFDHEAEVRRVPLAVASDHVDDPSKATKSMWLRDSSSNGPAGEEAQQTS